MCALFESHEVKKPWFLICVHGPWRHQIMKSDILSLRLSLSRSLKSECHVTVSFMVSRQLTVLVSEQPFLCWTLVDWQSMHIQPSEWLTNILCVWQQQPVKPWWQDIFLAGTACLFRQWRIRIFVLVFHHHHSTLFPSKCDPVLVEASSNQWRPSSLLSLVENFSCSCSSTAGDSKAPEWICQPQNVSSIGGRIYMLMPQTVKME